MRIIDKTPYLEEDGSISLVNRIQGTLKYGLSWYGNLKAEAKAVAYFNKQLDKKFTLIRNHTLGASQIMVPFILVGPPGVYVFMVTDEAGTYQAKGNSWGKIEGEKYKDASINIVKRAKLFSKAVEMYLEKQEIELPEPVKPIVCALNPGMYIETIRPEVRVVMRDALDRFSVSLRQMPPIITVTDVHQVADLILSPLNKKPTAEDAAQNVAPEANDVDDTPAYDPYADQGEAPAEVSPFGDVGFSFDEEEAQAPAFEEEPVAAPQPVDAPRSQQAAKRPRRKAPQKGLWGMTNKQLIILAIMAGFIALMLILVIILALVLL